MRTLFLAVTGICLGVAACTSGETSVLPVERKPVASVSIRLPSPSLVVGQTQSGSASALDASGAVLSGRTITWGTSSAAVAQVDGSGLIAAVSPGSATISAESEGVTGQASLSVMSPDPVPVASVSVALAAGALNPGQTTQATATARDANNNVLAGRSIAWSSSNTAVATVDASGVVRAVAVGSAQITASSEGQSGSAALSVTSTPPVAVASVSVTLANSSRNPGQTTQATATTRDANNNVLTGRSISWSSSNTTVATVSGSGLVTAVAVGTAQITATSEGQAGSATLTVPPPVPVASVTVVLAASSRNPGQTTQATATTRDANNNVLTGRSISWSSSNTTVATVSGSGLVTAVAVGTAQITATSEGQAGSATLTVAAPPPVPVASVAVALAASSLNPGQTTQASATTRDANNNVLTGRVITWTSSNTGVATVSSSGLVTAIAVGTVQILAACEGQNGSSTLTVTSTTPAPVASVTVSLANGTLNPGQATQATATTRDANNNILTGRAISWGSDNTAIATVDQAGVVTAVAVGSANITATSETISGSASLGVQVAGSSNEPSGMTVISDRPFNALHELGWDEPSNGGNGGSIVSDATAPKSPSNILRMTLPAGFGGGSASYDGDSPGFSRKTLYISWWSRISSNWQGHNGSGVNKQFYVYTSTDVPSVYVDLHGSGAGTLTLQIAGQNISAGGAGYGDPGNPDWTPNLGVAATIVRGQWFRGELLLTMNTSGASNGAVDWWLNGVHVGHIGGVMFQSSAPSWRSVHYADVWGGGGGTVTNTMWMDFDHLYLSGK